MSLSIEDASSVPEQTRQIARAAFPKGNLYLRIRDTLGTFFTDTQFADLFAAQGQRAQAPWRLALVSVFQFAEGLSDRQAADAVRSRIDWKYALGLELTDPGFDYSVLSQFRQRLITGTAELRLLETMLHTFKEQELLKAGGRQRTDSTHVLAAVRVLNRLERVGETLRHALHVLAELAPNWLQSRVPAEWYARYGSRMDNSRFPKSETERAALATQIGADGLALLAWIDQATQMPWLQEVPAVVTLRAVWRQQYTDPPEPPRLREADERAPSAELICSAYDIEARFSTKRDFSWVGYRVHLTQTCAPDRPNLITDVLTTEATSPDENKLPVIQEALNQRDLLPSEQLVDAGYTDAGVLATSHHTYGVQVTAPLTPDPSWQAHENTGFDKTQLRIDWEAQVVTCPAGKQSHSWLPSTKPKDRCAYWVRFAKKDCDACEHRRQCTRSKKEPRELTLQTKEAYEALHAARRRQQTPEFKEAYKARAGIESAHEQGQRRCGLQQARYIGLAKTHLQHILCACALNLLRVGEWLAGTLRAKTRVSRFARLAPVG
jgi:transposase